MNSLEKPINQRINEKLRWWLLPLNRQLLDAVSDGDLCLVNRLLGRGADPNGGTPRRAAHPCNPSVYPLHRVCYLAELDVASALLNAGASLNLLDDEGRTPLHHWFRGLDDWMLAWWPGQPDKFMPSTMELGALLFEKDAELDEAGVVYTAQDWRLSGIHDKIASPARARGQQDLLRQSTPAVSQHVRRSRL